MFKWFTGKNKEASTAVEPKRPEESPSPVSYGGDGLSKLREAFSLTRQSVLEQLKEAIQGTELHEDTIDQIEESLIRADVGLNTAMDIADKLRKNRSRFSNSQEFMAFLETEFSQILTPYEVGNHLQFNPNKLNVYLVVGVNGAGKTTFIGKLAHRFVQAGYRTVIGAGDTFRAAAEEQVEIWAQRAGAEIVRRDGSDPSGVIFEAIQQAKNSGAQAVILDTAGRLQNKFNLMEELKKIRKVIDKAMPEDAVFESLLVLDATTGQNALRQAEVFKEAVNITGVVLTKMDSSAKGGVILTIAKEYGLPVKMVGVGEGIDDLKEFNAKEFIKALFVR
jgi:fused signal recognition particle receptor